MNHKDQLDGIARDWANGKMALYEALYEAHKLGYNQGYGDGCNQDFDREFELVGE